MNSMCLRVQQMWRMVRARRRVKALKEMHKHSRRLTKALWRCFKKHKFRVKWQWQQAHALFAVKIQTLFRRVLAINAVHRKVQTMRRQGELKLFIHTKLNQLLASVQLQLLSETIGNTIGKHKVKLYQ
jgi:hypothetical protein